MFSTRVARRFCGPFLQSYSRVVLVPAKIQPLQIPKISLDEFIWRKTDRWLNKTAIVCADSGQRLTFGQLKTKCDRLACWLQTKSGLQPGHVVAIAMFNAPEYCIALLGCIKAGLVVTTLNPGYTPEEAARQLKDSGARLLFTQTEMWPTLSKAISLSNVNIRHIIMAETGKPCPNGTVRLEELCQLNLPPPREPPTRKLTDLVLLPYSSGTTGLPKGVCLTHQNMVANLTQMQADNYRLHQETTLEHQDIAPVILPMYHLYALAIIALNLLSEGCQIVMLSKYRPNLFLDLLQKYQPTVLHAVPPLIHLLSDPTFGDAKLLDRIRYVLSAAAPLSAEDMTRFIQKFGPNIKILQGYGLTETSPLTHLQRTDKYPKAGGSGWCLPATQCRVVDENNTDLKANQPGEILIRGPQVMEGYLGNPQATANMIQDGWLRTGDIGFYDEDDQFFITDRLKELIKVRGFQVAPAELEALLRDHPDVRDAAVIGIPHKRDGETPLAFIVPKDTASEALGRNIIEYVEKKAAKHKRLSGVRFIQVVPRNPSGKILRRQLKQML